MYLSLVCFLGNRIQYKDTRGEEGRQPNTQYDQGQRPMHKPLLRKEFLLNHVEMGLSDTSRCACMVLYCIDTTLLPLFLNGITRLYGRKSVLGEEERGGRSSSAQLHPP